MSVILLALACAKPTPPVAAQPMQPVPPIAEIQPAELTNHGDTRIDDYYWMRERDDPRVRTWLEAENTYAEAMTAHNAPLRKALFDEMLARIQEDDTGVPWRKGGYLYYSRTEAGKPYSIFCRREGGMDAPEEILLDQNVLGEGLEYMHVGEIALSPDHTMLAYSVDVAGDELYTVHVRDLETGEELPDAIPDTTYGLEWTDDALYYVTVDEALRPYKLWRHELGAPEDTLIFEEPDERFWMSLHKTRGGGDLVLSLGSAITSEVHLIDAHTPVAEPVVVRDRVQGVEYDLVQHEERLFLRINDDGVNFRVLEVASGEESVLIAHDERVMIEELIALSGRLVVHERRDGVLGFRVIDLESGEEHTVAFDDATYEVWPGTNAEFETGLLRFEFSSFTTPRSVFDYDLETRERGLLKEWPVLGEYDRTQYKTERVSVTAPDGTAVPMSLVYHKDTPLDGSAPAYLTGYGSYGVPYDPYFTSTRLTLLDRGFVFGIAHIRGGGDLGRAWYEDGKFLHKRNTFSDFVACADHLVSDGYTSAERLAISGGSAGGLLMGAVTNARPDLFGVVVAHVPFVDVLTTMLDETIPLTVTEWEEWGNPADSAYYEYMKGYSPYDNVAAVGYPDMLVTAGLNDPRVQYWEPAKWVAKMRAVTTGDNVLLLKTHMGAGHAGASGRYGYLEDRAFEYAFVLDRLDVAE